MAIARQFALSIDFQVSEPGGTRIVQGKIIRSGFVPHSPGDPSRVTGTRK
jgi:hypothetical protein